MNKKVDRNFLEINSLKDLNEPKTQIKGYFVKLIEKSSEGLEASLRSSSLVISK